MAADGATYNNRVNHFSNTSQVMGGVVDNILSTPTLWSRFNSMAKPFNRTTIRHTLKVTSTDKVQEVVGDEALYASASDTTIQLEYNDVGITHPTVKILLEHMRNEGESEEINLSDFIDSEAVAEIRANLAAKIYSGSSYFNGLNKIVDDGTDFDTIGGQSRTTYPVLAGYVYPTGGAMTLAKISTTMSAISDGDERPTIGVSGSDVWNLYETLMSPRIVQEYATLGYPKLGLRSFQMNPTAKTQDASATSGGGLTAIHHRGTPIVVDKYCPAQRLYFLNENMTAFYGRTKVPKSFKGDWEKVNLGSYDTSAYELPYSKPSDSNGWFYMKEIQMPYQLTRLGRFLIVGQLCTKKPSTNGVLTGITTVA